jgi:hypothetical protein
MSKLNDVPCANEQNKHGKFNATTHYLFIHFVPLV